MLYSFEWLKELSGTRRSPAKLAELLLTHAFEVESIERYEHGLENIIIGRVLSVSPHPNADRLRIAEVETGKEEKRKIVCGAPNLEVGQKVAVILPGHRLPNGTVIKETEIRSVLSQGMICSAKELEIGENGNGILVLDSGAPVGHSFANYLRLNDSILDIKVLPDRSDALAYEGMAREIAALEGFRPAYSMLPAKSRPRTTKHPKFPKVQINTDNCSRYILALFRNVSIHESPLFIRKRLLVSGIRPINNVVDITNYLMLETGQPMHAFDADTIGRGGIVVRQGRAHERLTLLDGTPVTLSRNDMVIADTKHALGVAGIMGGKRSGITKKTTNVAIEIAVFKPSVIRKTRERLRFLTDASFRFERGIDIERPMEALTHLVPLMEAHTEGEYGGARDVLRTKTKVTKKKITVSLERVEKLLGSKVTLVEVVQFFALLGLGVRKIANRKELQVTIPARRMDLRDEWDLIEEVGRMRGYGKIEPESPLFPLEATASDPKKQFERRLKTSLADMGFDEVMAYSFYGKNLRDLDDEKKDALMVLNPMNPDQAYMRLSLLPGLLKTAERNSRALKEFSIFELGSVFEKGKRGPLEKKKVALLETGPEPKKSFFSLKGKLEAFFADLGLKASFQGMAKTLPLFHPVQTAVITVDGHVVGQIGTLHPRLNRTFGLRGGVALAELDNVLLEELSRESLTFAALQRFPFAFRDISLTGPKKVSYAEIEALLFEAGAPLLVEARLFDLYEEGEEKSLAFHLGFGHPDRTIKSGEMDAAFDTIVRQAETRLGFRLRLS